MVSVGILLVAAGCAVAPPPRGIESPLPRRAWPAPSPCAVSVEDVPLDVAPPALGTTGPAPEVPGAYVERDQAGAIDRIYLAGRVRNTMRYRGPLPHGLQWTMTASQAIAKIESEHPTSASSDAVRIGARRDFLDLGVRLEFAGRCLGRVELFEPIAPDELRVRRLTWSQAVRLGAKGIQFAVESRSWPGKGAIEIVIGDADGRELAVVKDGFVAYAGLALPPGPHTLTATIRGVAATARQLTKHEVPIEMPRRWRLRIGVSEIVAAIDADADATSRGAHSVVNELRRKKGATSPFSFERADPRWKLGYGSRYVHVSAVRRNARRARWTRRAPWITVAEGDTFTIEVEDVDLVFHDRLATFTFDVQTVIASKATPKPVHKDAIELRLMKPLIRRVD